jgi:hypothetical protein
MDRSAAVQVVERIVALLPTTDLRMALVTGSVARGLDDESSDLDVYLYWERTDGADTSAFSNPDRFTPIAANRAFGVPRATGWFSKLDLDGRFVDVEDVDVSTLSRAVRALDGEQAPPGWAVKVAVGIRDAMAVLGRAELASWQQRLTCHDAAAAAEVAARLPRLLAPSALFELTYGRGDVLSYAARLSGLALDVVAVLGTVNRRFIPVDEPKWLPWHLAQLTLVPTGLHELVHAALSAPSATTSRDLDAAVGEVLDLVDAHVPSADTRAARDAMTLRPRPGQ